MYITTPITTENIPVENGALTLLQGVFPEWESQKLFVRLLDEISWQQPLIHVAGKKLRIPRLQAWHGDTKARYHYSGLSLDPAAWTELLLLIKTRVEQVSNTVFNSLLLNRYRDGRDSVGWHSDDEVELGRNPTIASLSLGATRSFRLQHKNRPELKVKLELQQGSVLVMAGELQHHWRHQLPKTQKPVGERVNLTFRRIYT